MLTVPWCCLQEDPKKEESVRGPPSNPPRPEHGAGAHPGSAELAASIGAALEPRSSVGSVGSSSSAAGTTILLHCAKQVASGCATYLLDLLCT